MHPSPTSRLGQYYDAIPYASYAYAGSSPEHLAAIAHAFGLQGVAPGAARILEIGCASGGNLIPCAMRNPYADCVGIDLSREQIRQGQSIAKRLGLSNIHLVEADFESIDVADFGKFDYIICHGLYSWIPVKMQGSLLALCARLLSESGILYVSYNTYPGWKSKDVIRDAMLLHCRHKSDPKERVAYAKAMLGFLRKVTDKSSLIAHMLEDNIKLIDRTSDDYLSHDYLEPDNNPCYFEEFVAKAGDKGLHYLAESSLRPMRPENYGREVAEPLVGTFGSAQVTMEQYLDFVTDRSFRQTLLVHQAQSPRTDYQLKRHCLEGLHYAANLPCRSGRTRDDGSIQRYGKDDHSAFATNNTMVKRIADALTSAWPNTLTRQEVVNSTQATISHTTGNPSIQTSGQIADDTLLHLMASGICKFRTHRILSCQEPKGMPLVDPLVRKAIAGLHESDAIITNAWHETIDISAEEKLAYSLMDGTRSIADIAKAVHEMMQSDMAAAMPRIEALVEKARRNALMSSARWQ